VDPQQLKQALTEDIRTIKTLNPEIIPARAYYGGLLKGVCSGFWKFFLILFLTQYYGTGFNDKHPLTWLHLVHSSGIAAFFFSAVAMLILLPPLSFFVQFRFHLEKKLKTGPWVVKKGKQISMLFFGLFAVLCAVLGSYASEEQVVFMLVLSFFLSLGAAHLVVNMELSRIGFSSIFTLINEFFSKGKSISMEETQE
jgi:MFS family permease